MRALMSYAWPGNVRELHAALEYSLVRSHGGAVEVAHLPEHVLNPKAARRAAARDCNVTPETVRSALAATDGSRSEAAERLGISRVTLWRKMKEWNIEG